MRISLEHIVVDEPPAAENMLALYESSPEAIAAWGAPTLSALNCPQIAISLIEDLVSESACGSADRLSTRRLIRRLWCKFQFSQLGSRHDNLDITANYAQLSTRLMMKSYNVSHPHARKIA